MVPYGIRDIGGSKRGGRVGQTVQRDQAAAAGQTLRRRRSGQPHKAQARKDKRDRLGHCQNSLFNTLYENGFAPLPFPSRTGTGFMPESCL
jgi:hypothetical protein